jgi:hypothetical protein
MIDSKCLAWQAYVILCTHQRTYRSCFHFFIMCVKNIIVLKVSSQDLLKKKGYVWSNIQIATMMLNYYIWDCLRMIRSNHVGPCLWWCSSHLLLTILCINLYPFWTWDLNGKLLSCFRSFKLDHWIVHCYERVTYAQTSTISH